MAQYCVDASLVLLWLLPEELTERAYALKDRWDRGSTELVAPPLLLAEVPSGLRRAVYRGRIAPEAGEEAFKAFLDMRVRILLPERLLERAWDLGQSLNTPHLYDFYYVALASLENCELWTADKRLVNLVQGRFPLIRWVGQLEER